MNRMTPKKNPSGKFRKLIMAGGFLIPFFILLLAGMGYGAYQLTYLPKVACNSCHNIRPYVESYFGSDHLDNLHNQANVGCKECHKASFSEMAGELVTYISGDYQVPMRETELSNETCLSCHLSYENVREKTSDLVPNPHDSPHDPNLACTTCHNSHRESELLCDQCHQFELTLP